jgi:hypothetical protein
VENQGQAIKATGNIIKLMFKAFLYLLWGISRVTEVLLSETNKLLKRVLEKKE